MMKHTWIMMLTLLCLAGTVWGQGVLEPLPLPEADPDAVEDMQTFIPNLTPAEVELLIAIANERRLTLEREQVIAELRQDLLFDPDQVDEAIAYLEGNPATSREQSIQRIYEALALVDADFETAMQQYTNGQFSDAAQTVKRDIIANEATYLAAARQLFYADALRDAGEAYPALDAYDALLKNMGERISFASTATLNAASVCRERHEYIDTMMYYATALKDYGLTLTEAEYDEGLEFIKKYKAIYDNPMQALSDMMRDVEGRLANGDSGEETQAIQREIVAIIEDMVASRPPDPNAPPPPPGGEGGEDGEEEGQRRRNQRGDQAGRRATSPMSDSQLGDRDGEAAMDRSQEHTTEESGDWASLPPREREKLQELAQRGTDERYRKLAVDYHRKLAEDADE
jgi:hypothetical protein